MIGCYDGVMTTGSGSGLDQPPDLLKKPADSGAVSPAAGSRREPWPDLADPHFYINRELSWLEFNQRVLLQALDPTHPLLERVKFLSIVATNLDEFFMVRVATLLRKFRADSIDVSPDGLDTQQQLAAIRERASRIMREMSHCWTAVLQPALAKHGVVFLERSEYTDAIRAWLGDYFRKNVHPVLTPLAFDPGHPFPYISNLSMNLAVVVRHGGRTRFARVKLPDLLPRFIQLPPEVSGQPRETFVFLEDVAREHIGMLFPGATLQGVHLFRVVRDTDMVIQEDEADDLLESVDRTLKELRYGSPSQLVVESTTPDRELNILLENFEIEDEVVERTPSRMGYGHWLELVRLHRPKLKDAPFSPRPLWSDDNLDSIFDEVRERDYLLHHPFDSFASVEAFLRAAVGDPQVIAIKMTLYRIGSNSPLVDMLIEAAEAGKQVAVLVELKARFDERNNIVWAHRMEAAGIHVVYGLVNLKTHCKLCLVVRKEIEGIVRYVHVGTGNYNRATAHVYTDIGLFTANPAIVTEVSDVFNYLTGYSNKKDYRELLVAPLNLRAQFTALIEREAAHARAGRPARIIVKNNSVADPEMIRVLYRASRAGVRIDMIVRGVCCLRPGIPGVSENIQVRSIVGRFLEHSRLYYFENGGEPELLIGSADLMERNLDRRVEALCFVRDPAIREHLVNDVLGTLLSDTCRAMELRTDGSYHMVDGPPDGPVIDAQAQLLERHSTSDA